MRQSTGWSVSKAFWRSRSVSPVCSTVECTRAKRSTRAGKTRWSVNWRFAVSISHFPPFPILSQQLFIWQSGHTELYEHPHMNWRFSSDGRFHLRMDTGTCRQNTVSHHFFCYSALTEEGNYLPAKWKLIVSFMIVSNRSFYLFSLSISSVSSLSYFNSHSKVTKFGSIYVKPASTGWRAKWSYLKDDNLMCIWLILYITTLQIKIRFVNRWSHIQGYI